jgi:hypothetical protein
MWYVCLLRRRLSLFLVVTPFSLVSHLVTHSNSRFSLLHFLPTHPQDGSETLSIRLTGVPNGVQPFSSIPGGVVFIGSGSWSVALDAVPTLALPPVPEYSGDDPYPGLVMFAVTQEKDSDEATSLPWTVDFAIQPVVDGFATWNTNELVNEDAIVGGLSLGEISLEYTLIDGPLDNSEFVSGIEFDLANLIADAQMRTRLEKLLTADGITPAADLPGLLGQLVANYLSTPSCYVYDPAAGTVTVTPACLNGFIAGAFGFDIALDERLFDDSNIDFGIPLRLFVIDTAVIDGATIVVGPAIEAATLQVDLVGVADIPTVFAQSVEGPVWTPIPMINFLGGVSTDLDAVLNRPESEEIYYIITETENIDYVYSFTDENGAVLGFDRGGSWFLRPEDMARLHVYTALNANVTLPFSITTVAKENDGDIEQSEAVLFDVTFIGDTGGGPGPGDDIPEEPLLTINDNSMGVEDNGMVINLIATEGAGDTTNPVISVTLSNLPPGFSVTGATFNPLENEWSALASAFGDGVSTGTVRLIPPQDFSGNVDITVEAVATSNSFSDTSGPQTLTAFFEPVADGVTMNFTPGSGIEDQSISSTFSFSFTDVTHTEGIYGEGSAGGAGNWEFASRTFGPFYFYVQLPAGVTSIPGGTQVLFSDADASLYGESLVGFYRIEIDPPNIDLLSGGFQDFTIDLLENWHGEINGELRIPIFELLDDEDLDFLILSGRYVHNLTFVGGHTTTVAPLLIL